MKSLIIANWKCNPESLEKAKLMFNSIQRAAKKSRKIEVVICPPFLYLDKKTYSNFKIGAQNCFWEQAGAFTGEISAKMLKNIGCKYILIGHSERRRILNENNSQINKKLKSAIKAKICPVLCIGETLEQKKQGKMKQVLQTQLFLGLKGVSRKEIEKSKISIAYEPVWAISTTTNKKKCSSEEAHIMNLVLRKMLVQKYGKTVAHKIRILYGGSVDSKNVRGFIYEAKMDGILVGKASLSPQEFIEIIKALEFSK
ncbi:MAG: triose-phosphate isomerase [Candidatus Pacebacteria bacterium]|nr:triose-phosphate isomerase [Candidatus Paceibacterota bacterium]